MTETERKPIRGICQYRKQVPNDREKPLCEFIMICSNPKAMHKGYTGRDEKGFLNRLGGPSCTPCNPDECIHYKE